MYISLEAIYLHHIALSFISIHLNGSQSHPHYQLEPYGMGRSRLSHLAKSTRRRLICPIDRDCPRPRRCSWRAASSSPAQLSSNNTTIMTSSAFGVEDSCVDPRDVSTASPMLSLPTLIELHHWYIRAWVYRQRQPLPSAIHRDLPGTLAVTPRS